MSFLQFKINCVFYVNTCKCQGNRNVGELCFELFALQNACFPTLQSCVVDLSKMLLGLCARLNMIVVCRHIGHSIQSAHNHNPSHKTLRPCATSLSQLGRRPEAIIWALPKYFRCACAEAQHYSFSIKSDRAIRFGIPKSHDCCFRFQIRSPPPSLNDAYSIQNAIYR